MASKEPKEYVLNVKEDDFFQENKKEFETKEMPEILITVIKKINLKNEEEEMHDVIYDSNDEVDEIEEDGEIKQKNMMNLKDEIDGKRNEGQIKSEEEDRCVEIERVMMEESTWEEMEESLQERNEKKGFLKKIIEKWT